jgi:hypothetical protein
MTRIVPVLSVFIPLLAVGLAAQAPTPQASRSAMQSRALAFVKALGQAMSRRDRDAVADMVRYPLSVSVGGIGVPVASRAEMLRLYDGVFTAELRCLVDDTVAGGAKALSVDAGGASFGSGRVHVADVGGTLKITSIDVPRATGISAPPNPPPRRVTVLRGDAQYSGRLYGDGVDAYVVTARRGTIVQARIEQFSGRNASVRVVEQKTGKSLTPGGGAAPRFVTATIAEPGEYRVEVVRLAPYCQPSFTYLLTVTIK